MVKHEKVHKIQLVMFVQLVLIVDEEIIRITVLLEHLEILQDERPHRIVPNVLLEVIPILEDQPLVPYVPMGKQLQQHEKLHATKIVVKVMLIHGTLQAEQIIV